MSNGCKKSYGLCLESFERQQEFTGTNIVFNSSEHRGPPEITASKVSSFLDTKMFGRGRIIAND